MREEDAGQHDEAGGNTHLALKRDDSGGSTIHRKTGGGPCGCAALDHAAFFKPCLLKLGSGLLRPSTRLAQDVKRRVL